VSNLLARLVDCAGVNDEESAPLVTLILLL